MITVSFCFPHHASRQVELRTVSGHRGSPATATVGFQHHASRQTEWRSTRGHAGSPLTATLSLSAPPITTELRLQYLRAGNSVTAKIALGHPPVRTELRSTCDGAGSSVTTIFAFSYPPKQTELRSIHAQAGCPVTARFAFPRLPTQTVTLQWETDRKTYTTAKIRFRNDYRSLVTTSIGYCYDWKTIVMGAAVRYQHRSLVQTGWRIIAKNLETGESLNLGLIDTENLALEDVFLPDGDYEISVLTSSLFWKDCLDRTVRTISVRPGESPSPLPFIYNLRSSIGEGMTTIRWSASYSEVTDCVFGVWFSSDSPVDTSRPSDTTVWYSNTLTEYQTSFHQNAPAYIAVAPIRTGNQSEIGVVKELYLDWSGIPPFAPDDVVLFDKPLPAIDPTIATKHADDPNLSLWV